LNQEEIFLRDFF